MNKLPVVSARVRGEKYLLADEIYRTTFVVGLSEMLNLSITFSSEYAKSKIESQLEYINSKDPDVLRKLLDDYLNANPDRHKFAVAASFIAAIDECI